MRGYFFGCSQVSVYYSCLYLVLHVSISFISFVDEVRERRGCGVVKKSDIGNCTTVQVTYEERVVTGQKCYCNDGDLCNDASSWHSKTSSILDIVLFISLVKYIV
jgi:hypothetical protein